MIIIANKSIPSDAFLSNQLGIRSFTDVVYDNQSHHDHIFKKLTFFKNDIPILFAENIPTIPSYRNLYTEVTKSFKNRNLSLAKDESIFYMNLGLVFKNSDHFNNLLEKIWISDLPIHLACKSKNSSPQESASSPIGIFKIPYGRLQGNHTSDLQVTPLEDDIEIDCTEALLNLEDPEDALNLFFSKVELRHFNKLETSGPYFKKISTNKKIQREFKFLDQIPEPVRPFFPQTGQFRKIDGEYSYEIERIFAFDAARIFVHQGFTKKSFNSFLEKIQLYLSRCPSKDFSKERRVQVCENLFCNKLLDRYTEIKDTALCENIDSMLKITGNECLETQIQKTHESLKKEINALAAMPLRFSHGDLCFSNMLFDPQTHLLKLIDPRGIDNEDDFYLPSYYDYAKLSHSILGLYDSIIYNLVDFKLGPKFEYQMENALSASYTSMMQSIFQKWLKKSGINVKLLRLIEASLFFSMLPLHKDYPKRVLMQVFSGCAALRAYHGKKNF